MINLVILYRVVVILFLVFGFSQFTFATENQANYKLLILDSQQGHPYDEVRAALLQGLNDDGYIEGKNLQIRLKVMGNDINSGERILREEIKNHYDVIFVGGTVATISAKNVLYGDMTQPVVFGAPTDPVGIGVITAFNTTPTANFTGISYPVPVKARLRFIKRLLPTAKKLGLIYVDMPQSHSYNQWLQDIIAHDSEFTGLEIIFRSVPLITGENGDILMAEAAMTHIKALDSQVDAFIKPNDQMGTRQEFAQIVYKTASKPLIGIVKNDVMARWGAAAVIYPSHDSIGQQAARMIKALFEGKSIADLPAEWPEKYGFAVDLLKSKQFHITVPVELLLLSGDNIIK